MGRRRNVYRTNGDSWKVGQFGFALTVIGLGAVSLAVASVRHHQDVRHLRTAYGPVPRSNAVVIAQLVSWVWAVGWFSSRGIAGIEAAPRAVCTWLLARLLQQGISRIPAEAVPDQEGSPARQCSKTWWTPQPVSQTTAWLDSSSRSCSVCWRSGSRPRRRVQATIARDLRVPAPPASWKRLV